MRTIPVVALAGALAMALPSAHAQNLLTNGNLDLTNANVIVDNAPPGAGPEDFYLPKPTGWTNVGTRSITGAYEDEMSSEPWAGPAPTPVTTDGLANGPHPAGCGGDDCAVFFKPFSGNTTTNGAATGHLIQDNPASPGLRYTLTGWAGAEPNVVMGGAEFALEFLDLFGAPIPASGATINLLPTLIVDNGEAFDYKQYSVSATAPASAAIVRSRASMIDGLGNPAGGGQAFVIDDFVLTAVPEPTSAALALAGLLGASAFRRRR